MGEDFRLVQEIIKSLCLVFCLEKRKKKGLNLGKTMHAYTPAGTIFITRRSCHRFTCITVKAIYSFKYNNGSYEHKRNRFGVYKYKYSHQ